MTNKSSTFGRYEIVLMRLNPSRDWLCDLIILQLPLLFDVSFNKYVAFEIMVLVEKTS